MSPVSVIMKVFKLRGMLISFLVCSVLIFSVKAKPANVVQSSTSSVASPVLRPSKPIYTPRAVVSSAGRKVLQTWNEDGSWQASARLPTSSQNGGNDRSRYKIRRDGSLSLALQIPKAYTIAPNRNKFQNTGSIIHTVRPPAFNNNKNKWASRSNEDDHSQIDRSSQGGNNENEARQFSPAELRSFSVVISDVDVSGDYDNKNGNLQAHDAYEKAGVSSYHLKSNSIHRMNASWKLKPGNGTPTSSDLLEFLSYFANGDRRATRSENEQINRQKRPLRKILGQEKGIIGEIESGQIAQSHHSDDKNEDQLPFQTWQESSRNIPPVRPSTQNPDTVVAVDDSSILLQKEPEMIFFTTTATINPKMTTAGINKNGIGINTHTTTDTLEYGGSTINDEDNNGSETMNAPKVVLHELFSTLEELNKNIEREETENKTSSQQQVDIVEESRVNQTEDGTEMSIHEATTTTTAAAGDDDDNDDEMAFRHLKNQTELDQSSRGTSPEKSENKQQQVQVDVEMSESSMHQGNNGKEKDGDVFVQNDVAEFPGSSNNSNNDAGIARNSTEHHQHHLHNYDAADDHVAVDGEEEGENKESRRNAKSAFFHSPKSTNRNDANNNNATSTSATSLEDEESTDNANSRQRMKITDPQQTASDLKKLMSLILKSDGNRIGGGGSGTSSNGGGDGKSGTQVVNIVITPNQEEDESSSSNHPQQKNSPQKILFLKTPQVKQMLDIALTDPALSTAAQKIAAALENNPFPNPIPANIDHTYNNLPSHILNYEDRDKNENIMHLIGNGNKNENFMQQITNKNEMGQIENNDSPATPDGFPLSGNGFLNIHHPNLQFHQALHQMVVNGSTPTSINATTKTNIINIFVINFKENNNNNNIKQVAAAAAAGANTQTNQSPFRINIKPSPRPQYHIPKMPLPINSKPQSSQTTPNPLAYLDPSLIFNNKMGLAAGASDEDDENEGGGISSEKNYAPNKHFDTDHFGLSNSDKINIFDLLPGDIGTATAVQYAPGVDADSAVDASETNKNHNSDNNNNSNNRNKTVSHFPLTDIFKSNNSNGNNMMPATMATYGDYFADFLPDRSREPPGSDNMKPLDNVNIDGHDILSILTSRRPTPTTTMLAPSSSSGTGGSGDPTLDSNKLPPSLAHLEWIFKNQPPPKPQVSDSTLIKRNGQTNNNNNNGSGSGGGVDTGSGSDSMMEPDETSNSPVAYHGSTTHELIEYLLHLQNVSGLPVDSNGIAENMNLTAADQQFNSTQQPQFTLTNPIDTVVVGLTSNHSFGDDDNVNKINGTISSSIINGNASTTVEYTTKPPAFWKFGNKLPLGSFSPSSSFSTVNTEEALNNRLRKLLTAFGYSALPTLAAGAAATWPYWVPLMATGRRRRRRRSAVSSSALREEDGEIREIIKRRGQHFLSNLMVAATDAHENNNGNGTRFSSSFSPILGPSDRQLLSKSTKNSRREGTSGEQKWIKVDVITAATTAHPSSPSSSSSSTTLPTKLSSSPTSLNFEEMNGHSHHDKNETSFHNQSHNNRLRLNTKNNSDNNSSTTDAHAAVQKHDHVSIINNTTGMNLHDAHRQHDDEYDQNDSAKLKHHLPRPYAHEKNDRISLAEQQLDVPLLKNFLKNVLYNELSLTNMHHTPSPIPFPSASSSSSLLLAGNNAQKLYRPPPPTRLPFFSASSSTPLFVSSTSLAPPPLSEPVVLTQYPIPASTVNKIITKNGHHSFKTPQQQQQQQQIGGDNNKNNNNGAILLNTPFFRPSSTPLPPPSLLLFPEYNNNKGEDDSREEQQQMIAGSDKKVVSISAFSTPSPTSVYIHNRGDGTTSVMSTQAPPPVSLTHWQNNKNSPWGSLFGGGDTLSAASMAHLTSDKISSSSSSSSSTTTATTALGGHNDDSPHNILLSSGQLYDNGHIQQHHSNVDYFLNHFRQSNKRLQKIKLADSIKASERSYTSAALLPLWFPIFFGNHSQFSSKFKDAMSNRKKNHTRLS